MTFDKLNTHSLVTYVTQHQKQLHTLIVVLLSLYLIAFAAELLWRLAPEPQLSAPLPSQPAQTSRPSTAQSGVDIAKIQALNLFGNAEAAPPVIDTTPVTDAPETRLNLTLTGVVTSSVPSAATAIIEHSGTQLVYGLGDKIEGTNATLQQVFSDRVIIKNGVRNEALMLDGVDYNTASRPVSRPTSRPATSRPATQRPSSGPTQRRTLSQEAQQATAELRSRPASFTDFISISPKTENGRLVGYQVSPGSTPSLFQSAGLKAGDVVSAINGLDLTDQQQAREALSELRSAESLDLTVLRDGSETTISLDLPQPTNE